MRIKYLEYIVPATLAFVFGLGAWWIEKGRLALVYEVIESAPFPRGSGTGKYFIVRIQNAGDTKLERIEFQITFSSDVIESSKFADSALATGLSERPSALSGTIPLLNPDETVSVTVTTFGPTEVKAPTVVARAPGATARTKSEGTALPKAIPVLFAFLGVALAAVGFSYLTAFRASKVSDSISRIENLGEVSKRIEKSEGDFESRMTRLKKELQDERDRLEGMERKRREREKRYEQGEPEAHQLIFAMMNRAGLGHRFIELASDQEGPTYRRTALFLLKCLLTDEANRDRYVSVMESLSEIKEVSPQSKGFILYLLAKTEQFRGNSQAAIKWLGRCQEAAPLMYQHLMAQDPAFNLLDIEQYFGPG